MKLLWFYKKKELRAQRHPKRLRGPRNSRMRFIQKLQRNGYELLYLGYIQGWAVQKKPVWYTPATVGWYIDSRQITDEEDERILRETEALLGRRFSSASESVREMQEIEDSAFQEGIKALLEEDECSPEA